MFIASEAAGVGSYYHSQIVSSLAVLNPPPRVVSIALPHTRRYRIKAVQRSEFLCEYEACCTYPSTDLRSACNKLIASRIVYIGFERGCPEMIEAVVTAVEIRFVWYFSFSMGRRCSLNAFQSLDEGMCQPAPCPS